MIDRDKSIARLREELSATAKIKPDKLISAIFNEFKKFVINKDNLKDSIERGFFIYDYNFYIKHFKENVFEEILTSMILTFRKALKRNESVTIDFINKWQQYISDGIKNASEISFTEVNKNKIERLDLFAKVSFRQIGDLIEGSLKQYIKFFYGCCLISEDKINNLINNVKNEELGSCINFLIKENEDFSILYKSTLQNIKLNQWRNIANHNNYSIDNSKTIIARYGIKKIKEIQLTRKQLTTLSYTISVFYYLHKIAHTLICTDTSGFRDLSNISVTSDTIIAQIIESAQLYGFQIKEFKEYDNLWICDLLYYKTTIDEADPNIKNLVEIIGPIIPKLTVLLISTKNDSNLVEVQVNPVTKDSDKVFCGWRVLK